ncbi:MAG: hypothetical protein EHM59_05520 [Betaproteobacteria bacterium]|nr:MAG: hypothetical protein EHM59_05520 [Betaproteobacteria bacterium]
MPASPKVRGPYLDAFRTIAGRIADALADVPKRSLPVAMYVAGGAALHFYTGARISEDIDAVFSRRVVLPEDLDVAYRDADGRARLLYFDRQYNDTYGLLHESAHDDAVSLALEGVDSRVLDVRLLTPIDLAVSKIARLSDQDREDIAALARAGLVKPGVLRRRAEEALGGYVGDVARVRTSIDIACRIVEDAAPAPRKGSRR